MRSLIPRIGELALLFFSAFVSLAFFPSLSSRHLQILVGSATDAAAFFLDTLWFNTGERFHPYVSVAIRGEISSESLFHYNGVAGE